VDSANCGLSTTSRVDDFAWGDDNPSYRGADKTLIAQRDRLTILSRHPGTPVAHEAGEVVCPCASSTPRCNSLASSS
jgi:hypothetical protein